MRGRGKRRLLFSPYPALENQPKNGATPSVPSSSCVVLLLLFFFITRAHVRRRGNLASSQNRAELIGKLQGSAALSSSSIASSSFSAELYDVPRPHLYQHHNGGDGVGPRSGANPGKGHIVSNGTADGYVPMFGGGVKPVLIDPSVSLDRQE